MKARQPACAPVGATLQQQARPAAAQAATAGRGATPQPLARSVTPEAASANAKKLRDFGKHKSKGPVTAAVKTLKAPIEAIEGAKRGGLRLCLLGMFCHGAKRKKQVCQHLQRCRAPFLPFALFQLPAPGIAAAGKSTPCPSDTRSLPLCVVACMQSTRAWTSGHQNLVKCCTTCSAFSCPGGQFCSTFIFHLSRNLSCCENQHQPAAFNGSSWCTSSLPAARLCVRRLWT